MALYHFIVPDGWLGAGVHQHSSAKTAKACRDEWQAALMAEAARRGVTPPVLKIHPGRPGAAAHFDLK